MFGVDVEARAISQDAADSPRKPGAEAAGAMPKYRVPRYAPG